MKVIINIPNRKEITLAELVNVLDDLGEAIFEKTGVDLEIINNAELTIPED